MQEYLLARVCTESRIESGEQSAKVFATNVDGVRYTVETAVRLMEATRPRTDRHNFISGRVSRTTWFSGL